MKRTYISVLFAAVCLCAFSAVIMNAEDKDPAEKKAEKEAPEKEAAEQTVSAEPVMNKLQTRSYIIGLTVGKNLSQNFKKTGLKLSIPLLVKGLTHGLEGTKPLISQKDINRVNQEIMQEMSGKDKKNAGADAAENLKKGQEFLEKNKEKEGVVTTNSGLQYKVLEEGEGKKPAATDTVKVHYKGTLIDGTVFDSSYKRGKPATFPLNRVIKGWTEGVQLMKVGSKYKFFVPSALAYGERQAGNLIAPNSVLIFEVELLEIVKNPSRPKESPE